MSNPFDEEPQSGGTKNGFGTLTLSVKNVLLVTGDPGYTLPGVENPKDGVAWVFKGKKVVEQDANRHIVVMIDRTAKDGHAYKAFCDFMYWEKDAGCKIALPALRKHFGKNLASIFPDKSAEVQYEEVKYLETGNDGVERTRRVFKIVKVFENKAECEAAEKAYFGNLNQGREDWKQPEQSNGALPPEKVAELKTYYDALIKSDRTPELATAELIRLYGAGDHPLSAEQVRAALA